MEFRQRVLGRDELPSKFYCCITTEVMSDPCMAADGHNEPLPSLQLIPNHALRAMIVEELERRGGHIP